MLKYGQNLKYLYDSVFLKHNLREYSRRSVLEENLQHWLCRFLSRRLFYGIDDSIRYETCDQWCVERSGSDNDAISFQNFALASADAETRGVNDIPATLWARSCVWTMGPSPTIISLFFCALRYRALRRLRVWWSVLYNRGVCVFYATFKSIGLYQAEEPYISCCMSSEKTVTVSIS